LVTTEVLQRNCRTSNTVKNCDQRGDLQNLYRRHTEILHGYASKASLPLGRWSCALRWQSFLTPQVSILFLWWWVSASPLPFYLCQTKGHDSQEAALDGNVANESGSNW